MSNLFTYIITVHNAEDLLVDVIGSILSTRQYPGEVIAVIDGCTDRSEEIAKQCGVRVLHAPNVHEIASLNIGMRDVLERQSADYIVTVQDDVLLQDNNFEYMTLEFFRKRPKLAHMVYRMGCNYTQNFDITHLCENRCGYGFGTTLARHQWALRMAGCKSPSCIPRWFIEQHGVLDKQLCPRGYDDIELSLRALERGYETIVLATDWRSDLAWGGTRKTVQPIAEQDERNAHYVKQKYWKLLQDFVVTKEHTEVHDYAEL